MNWLRKWLVVALASVPFVMHTTAFAKAAEQQRTYPCYRSGASPRMDGILAGDEGWKAIPGVTGFYRLGDGYAEPKQTVAYATWDDDALYVALVCEEPDIAQVKTDRKDGEDLWLDDGAEIFIHPRESLNVYQFVVNTAGARRGGEGNPGNTTWEAAAQKGKGEWTVELRLPFSIFGRKPQSGEEWTATFCRNIFLTTSGGDQFTCWAPLQGRFLEPENYAVLGFHGQRLTGPEAQQIESSLNLPYRQFIAQQLKEASKPAMEYAKLLGEAANMQAFAAEAAALQKEWEEVLPVVQSKDTASMVQLRHAASRMRSLMEKSDGLKYKVLFEKLFEDR